MNQQIRAFVAIELDDALRAELERVPRRIKDERGAQFVRWVAPQNIHLTLEFLGNIASSRIAALNEAMARAANGIAPFELTARGLGCFPNTRRPNNVWIGLDGNVERAAVLAKRIHHECAALGLQLDTRPFEPHLTLGRVKREASNSDRAAIGEFVKNFPPTTFGTIHADSVQLIQSDLRAQGPIYTMLAKVNLRNA